MELKAVFLKTCLILFILCADALEADSNTSLGKQPGSLSKPETKILEKWRGTWDVKATRRQPQPALEVTYEETSDLILNGQYLRTETSRKSDGGESMSMIWFDDLTKSYRFVIFDASGRAVELPPPTWSESTQTMQWESNWFSPVSYTGYLTFTDPDTIRWKSLLKDWKGTVVVDIEGTSIRRK